jgi:hypothetical protein
MGSNQKNQEQIFGLTLSSILLLLSHLFLRREHFVVSKDLLITGIVILVLSLFWPKTIIFIQRPWEKVTTAIGSFVTAIILALVYYVFIVPYTLLIKLMGTRFFKKAPKGSTSYWLPKPHKSPAVAANALAPYERQF